MATALTTDDMNAVSFALEWPDQPAVRALVESLDALQVALYPAESNHFVDIRALCRPEVAFAVARDASGEAIGCVAILLRDGFAEIKRMVVAPTARGRGCGAALLSFIEAEAVTRGRHVLRLETGIRQPEAIRLYERAGYVRREAFAGYQADPLSVFMEKSLAAAAASVSKMSGNPDRR